MTASYIETASSVGTVSSKSVQALRGVPAEVGREKTPGLRLPRWGEGFLPLRTFWSLIITQERLLARWKTSIQSTPLAHQVDYERRSLECLLKAENELIFFKALSI